MFHKEDADEKACFESCHPREHVFWRDKIGKEMFVCFSCKIFGILLDWYWLEDGHYSTPVIFLDVCAKKHHKKKKKSQEKERKKCSGKRTYLEVPNAGTR